MIKKQTKKQVFFGEIDTTGKNFTLPAAVTAVTNLTSESSLSNTILTGKNHASHLPLLLKTWMPVAGSSVHIFTDSKPSKDLEDEISSIGAHIVNTGCRSDHSVEGLSCKMQEELTAFLHSSSKETRC